MDRTEFEIALVRMQAEYLEMPGLKLTTWQATRLWNLPADVCQAALRVLVVTGFLAEGDGAYFRRGSKPARIAATEPETWTVSP
jgi:hypothetical protein